MNEEFIPYEQALELKELGFDIPSINGYSYPDSDKLLTQAILYQQAFRFFREKHEFSYSIGRLFDVVLHVPLEGTLRTFVLPRYKTYEESELECVIKMIELTKIKNK